MYVLVYACTNEWSVVVWICCCVCTVWVEWVCVCVCRYGWIARSHVHMLEPPSLVSLSVFFLLVQWAHVWRAALFFFTSFLIFVRLRKVINHTDPAGEGSCGSGPTLPPWGTSFESYNPFLDPHFSVCGKPKKEGTPNLSYFMGALSTSRWCGCCHAGLGEERSLTNLDWWASWNRSVNVWICVLYRGTETLSHTNECWEKACLMCWIVMMHFAGHLQLSGIVNIARCLLRAVYIVLKNILILWQVRCPHQRHPPYFFNTKLCCFLWMCETFDSLATIGK